MQINHKRSVPKTLYKCRPILGKDFTKASTKRGFWSLDSSYVKTFHTF